MSDYKTFPQVQIEKLVHGGYGLAWSGGETLFVKNVLPGEVVNARQVGKKGGSIIAVPEEICIPSPQRRDPPCRYDPECGGCDWLYIKYPSQVIEKQKILTECLTRIGRLKVLPEMEIFSHQEWGYRIRVQFKTDVSNKKIGFYEYNTHNIVDITHCPLIDESLNNLLKKKDALFSGLSKSTRQLRAIAGQNGRITTFPLLKTMTHPFTEINSGSRKFKLDGNSFFQANRYLHHDLGTWARPWITTHYCLDLYGGTGFFSCMMGDLFNKGILVDSDKRQTRLARENLDKNDIKHFKVIHADSGEITADTIPFPAEKMIFIVDPPRGGLSMQVLHTIGKIMPAQLLYISCNPATQARDIGFLLKEHTYTLSHMALFDLYPNTHHIESGVILDRIIPEKHRS